MDSFVSYYIIFLAILNETHNTDIISCYQMGNDKEIIDLK